MYLFHLNIIKIRIYVEIIWNYFSHFHEVLRISEKLKCICMFNYSWPIDMREN